MQNAKDANDTRSDNEKKTGKCPGKMPSLDTFTVRAQLPTLKAVSEYDKYLKDHRRRLRQLEKLAAGEMSPSSQSYL